MSIMDLKYKGISWVGNIYKKFETVCHEVDNIVSQDTVKYVGNQMHTVGEDMKKFCSDVQDLIPPLVDPAINETQASKRNGAIDTNIRSVIGIKEDHGQSPCVNESPVDPCDFDPFENQMCSALNGIHLSNQLTTPTSRAPLKEAESDLSSGNIDNVRTNENFHISAGESGITEKCSSLHVLELIPSGEKESFEASLSGEFIDCKDEIACGFLAEISATTSVHDEQSPQKVQTVSDKSADDFDCIYDGSSSVVMPEIAVPDLFSQEKIEMEVTSSSSTVFTKPHILSETLIKNIPTEVASYGNAVNADGHDSVCSNVLLSSTSGPTVSCKNKVGENGLTSSDSALSVESIGRSDDSGMEVIDLSDKKKPEESCLIVDDIMLYEVPRRIRKLRSYKKKIQDVFTSKKKLTKEYEQLAIWYGDLDMGSSQDSAQRRFPSTTTITLDSDLQMHDSEWELL